MSLALPLRRGRLAATVLAGTFTLAGVAAAQNVGTSFTYQGRLMSGGEPASGPHDMTFRLHSHATNAAQIGAPLTLTGVPVSAPGGLFTVQLDFGSASGLFTGDARWLEIEVEGVTLSPRQPVRPAPYALALPGMRTLQNATSPNIVGGFVGNEISPDVHGATIGGGGGADLLNRALQNFSTIGGGVSNTATGVASTIGGGHDNTAGVLSTIGGGESNVAGGTHSTIGGGHVNTAGGTYSTIGGGYANIASGSAYASVGGGGGNTASNSYSTVGGGQSNVAGGFYSTVPGGALNQAGGHASFAAGYRARANHTGAFVWADTSTETNFTSTANNQFLIRATGVGIGTSQPTDKLCVDPSGPGGIIIGTPNITDGGRSALLLQVKGFSNAASSIQALHSAGVQWGNLLLNESGGNVGIGVSTPTFQLQLSANSAAKPTANTWTISSDARLKRNINTIEHALDDLLTLRGVTYQWIDSSMQGDMAGTYTGFIAQEVEPVFPEWISEDGDGYKTLTVIGFEGLVVEALRELRDEKNAEIEALRGENNELRSRLDTLEYLVAELLAARKGNER